MKKIPDKEPEGKKSPDPDPHHWSTGTSEKKHSNIIFEYSRQKLTVFS